MEALFLETEDIAMTEKSNVPAKRQSGAIEKKKDQTPAVRKEGAVQKKPESPVVPRKKK
jgi:hypothetical protein